MIKVKEFVNVKGLIEDKAIESVDRAIKVLHEASTESGMNPIATGKTKRETKKRMSFSNGEAFGFVYIGTDYAEYTYYGTSNGIKPGGRTGTGRWLEVAARRENIGRIIEKGMEI